MPRENPTDCFITGNRREKHSRDECPTAPPGKTSILTAVSRNLQVIEELIKETMLIILLTE